MNVEDEFFKAIEDRDTAIMARDKTIDEQGRTIDEQGKALIEKDKLLSNAIEGMLSKGMDMNTIASILGLTEDEVTNYLSKYPKG